MDAVVQTLGGKQLIATAADGNPLSFIGLPTFADESQVGVVGTNTALYQVAANVLTRLNGADYNAPPGTPWELALMLDNAYFLQPSDPIQKLADDSNAVIPLIATPGMGTAPIGYTMAEFYNHLMVGNIVGPLPLVLSPQDLIGSGLGADGDWSLGNINSESRSQPIFFKNYPLLCIRNLGDYLIAYKTFSVHLISYNPGTATVYSIEAIAKQTGPVGKQVVVVVASEDGQNDQHYFIGQSNVYMNDGAIHPIGERIWNDFRTKVMPGTWTQIIGWYHEFAKEVYWGFASASAGTGIIDTALVYDILNNCFYYRDWPFTAGGYMLNALTQDRWIDHPENWTQILPNGRPWVTISGLEDLSPFVGGPQGQLYQYEATPTPDFPALLQTGLDSVDSCGGDDWYKTCNGMRLDLSGLTPGKPFRIFGRGLSELSDYDTMPFSLCATLTGGSRADFFLTGRWFDFQFQCDAGGTFQLGEWEARYKKRGVR